MNSTKEKIKDKIQFNQKLFWEWLLIGILFDLALWLIVWGFNLSIWVATFSSLILTCVIVKIEWELLYDSIQLRELLFGLNQEKETRKTPEYRVEEERLTHFSEEKFNLLKNIEILEITMRNYQYDKKFIDEQYEIESIINELSELKYFVIKFNIVKMEMSNMSNFYQYLSKIVATINKIELKKKNLERND